MTDNAARAANSEAKYLTHNLHYAAYLLYCGGECVGVVASDYKPGLYDFAFKWIGNVKEYETNFFSNQATVEPRQYVKAIANLRDILNDHKAKAVAKGELMYK